jgi:hypothetical protein
MVSVKSTRASFEAQQLKGDPMRIRTIAIINRWRPVAGPRHIVRAPATRTVYDSKVRDG